jgi:hypothetical protein
MDILIVAREVLMEKGYFYIILGCVIALIVLLFLRKVLPRSTGIKALFAISSKKLYLEEEFSVRITLTALQKIKVEDLSFFVECRTHAPSADGTAGGERCIFFYREVAARDISLYPRCSFEESRKLRVPEKGLLCENNQEHKEEPVFLPGTFSSQNGAYAIIWKSGYRIKLRESYDPVEESETIVVYPVTAGW